LLGLAFRLAVARLVENCPFLMLDEPTYGLDPAHRDALLSRIGKHDLARQILLVTHHGQGVPGHRVKLERKEKETILVE
jgi:ABC-type transport system involved in cytochrome bd biosynthesis fused ATPase/permease subunit